MSPPLSGILKTRMRNSTTDLVHPQEPPRERRRLSWSSVRFPVLFLLFSLALMFLVSGPLSGAIQPRLCRLVASHSAFLLRLLGEEATCDGLTVISPRHAYQVIYACTSLPATILLVSAILAFPARALRKLAGIAAGVSILYVVNLLRLVSLYYVFLHWPGIYDRIHISVWQAALVVIALVDFILWARRSPGRRPE